VRQLSDSGGRFVRWQGIQITQLGFVLNLVLGFAVAGLGLWVSLLRDTTFQPHSCAKGLFILSAILLIFSIVTGAWCAMNRLWDFRITKDIARGKWEGDQLAKKRKESDDLGDRTWMLLYFEILAFLIATVFLVMTLFLVYRSKLF
jgi:hypothetical protein